MPGRWCPIAPKAPTNRNMSCALQRACAAVKIGISRTGVPTKSSRSRHRSRIQGDGLATVLWIESAEDAFGVNDRAGATACVAISQLINQKEVEHKLTIPCVRPKAKGGWHCCHPPNEDFTLVSFLELLSEAHVPVTVTDRVERRIVV